MKNFIIEIRWAVQFSLVSLVWMIFEKSMGWHDVAIKNHAIYTNVFAFVAIGIYFLALLDKKKNFFNRNMSWKQGFISGMILSAIIALLSPMVQYVTFTLITPSFFKNMIAYSVSHQLHTQSQAEMYFNMQSYMIQSVFGAFSFGVLTSAVVAYALRTKNTVNEK